MMDRYRVTSADLAALASGPAPAALLTTLRSAQLSKHLLLLKSVRERAAGHIDLGPAITALAAAQRCAPGTVSDVLAEPWVGVWASHCLRNDPPRQHLAADLAYLNALAAVAAIRTHSDADLTLPVRSGQVWLPTLGAVPVAAPDLTSARVLVRAGAAVISAAGTRLTVPANLRADGRGWYARRRLTASCDGLRLQLGFDDLEPWRDCYRIPVAPPVPPARYQQWQRLFAGAWHLLVRHLRPRAVEIASSLRAIVPLAAEVGGAGLSGTARYAFGAFGLTRPADATAFAVTMVHEFQHAKLGAMLDLVPLYRHAGIRHFAPWRLDPRPIGGLIQGVYAFLGVAEAWCCLRGVSPAAEWRFAEVREQVRYVAEALLASPELTASGRAFAAAIRSAAAEQMAVELPAALVTRAREALRRNESAWRRATCALAGSAEPPAAG